MCKGTSNKTYDVKQIMKKYHLFTNTNSIKHCQYDCCVSYFPHDEGSLCGDPKVVYKPTDPVGWKEILPGWGKTKPPE